MLLFTINALMFSVVAHCWVLDQSCRANSDDEQLIVGAIRAVVEITALAHDKLTNDRANPNVQNLLKWLIVPDGKDVAGFPTYALEQTLDQLSRLNQLYPQSDNVVETDENVQPPKYRTKDIIFFCGDISRFKRESLLSRYLVDTQWSKLPLRQSIKDSTKLTTTCGLADLQLAFTWLPSEKTADTNNWKTADATQITICPWFWKYVREQRSQQFSEHPLLENPKAFAGKFVLDKIADPERGGLFAPIDAAGETFVKVLLHELTHSSFAFENVDVELPWIGIDPVFKKLAYGWKRCRQMVQRADEIPKPTNDQPKNGIQTNSDTIALFAYGIAINYDYFGMGKTVNEKGELV